MSQMAAFIRGRPVATDRSGHGRETGAEHLHGFGRSETGVIRL
jgi:hypothetical protein